MTSGIRYYHFATTDDIHVPARDELLSPVKRSYIWTLKQVLRPGKPNDFYLKFEPNGPDGWDPHFTLHKDGKCHVTMSKQAIRKMGSTSYVYPYESMRDLDALSTPFACIAIADTPLTTDDVYVNSGQVVDRRQIHWLPVEAATRDPSDTSAFTPMLCLDLIHPDVQQYTVESDGHAFFIPPEPGWYGISGRMALISFAKIIVPMIKYVGTAPDQGLALYVRGDDPLKLSMAVTAHREIDVDGNSTLLLYGAVGAGRMHKTDGSNLVLR